jgi:D-alanyl-D-alanine carboxypeptidase
MSSNIQRLFFIALVIIVLFVAANEGNKKGLQSHWQKQNGAVIIAEGSEPVTTNIEPGVETAPSPKPITEKVEISSRPLVSAEAYLVGNLDTGEIYIKHNEESVFPIASISKLITAMVSRRNMSRNQKITITQSMLDAYGEAGHLELGESFTMSELMYPLLLESSNDAAEALAQSYGYENFIKKMNVLTANLGMSKTAFQDASGLSPGNVSTAEDLFALARYIYLTEKPLLEITRKSVVNLASTTDHGPHTFHSINPFPLDPNFLGGKTGRTTEAKESMLSLFRYNKGLKSYPVAIIVLRSEFRDREIDSSILFEQFTQKIR